MLLTLAEFPGGPEFHSVSQRQRDVSSVPSWGTRSHMPGTSTGRPATFHFTTPCMHLQSKHMQEPRNGIVEVGLGMTNTCLTTDHQGNPQAKTGHAFRLGFCRRLQWTNSWWRRIPAREQSSPRLASGDSFSKTDLRLGPEDVEVGGLTSQGKSGGWDQ